MIKKIVLLLGISLLTAFFIASCSSDNSTNPPANDTSNYYPSADGNYYKYSVERTDSNGTKDSGTRSSTNSGTSLIGNVTYQVKIDSTTIANLTTTSNSYFRKTDAGVYFFLDTSGISNFIPDSLIQNIEIDGEMILYSFPLTDGKTWPVFKMKLNISVFTITLVELKASYQGMESITLNLPGGATTKDAAKIKYDLILTIPDPNNPLQTSNSVFTSYAWLVADIGVVKWEGNGTLVNAALIGEIDFADTTTVVSQSLIDFKVN